MAAVNSPAPDVGATRHARVHALTRTARRDIGRTVSLGWPGAPTADRCDRVTGRYPRCQTCANGPDLRTAITGLADHPYTRLVEIPIQARPEGAPNARSITRDAASRQVSAIGA